MHLLGWYGFGSFVDFVGTTSSRTCILRRESRNVYVEGIPLDMEANVDSGSITIGQISSRAVEHATLPAVGSREAFEAQLSALRIKEKELTHQSDALAAQRRRLPIVEVNPATKLIGENGESTLLDAFEGRRQLIAYYFMWHAGRRAKDQCQGCTWVTAHMGEAQPWLRFPLSRQQG